MTKENENVLNELILFVRNEIGEYNMPISENTTLEDDLGVTGADGYELIQAFSKKYSIDISKLEFDKYFYPEPSFFTVKRTITMLTIGDLYKAIGQGFLK